MKSNGKNFSIVLPGGCNARCKFCTDRMEGRAPKSYLLRVKDAIAKLPSGFTDVSITGGEPTISPYFKDVLNIIKDSGRFNKVVLTTNGTNLLKHHKLITDTVNHINISRHRYSEEDNARILGVKCISDIRITQLAESFGRFGVDITFNRVYSKGGNISKRNVTNFVSKAKDLGVSAICYRYNQNHNSLKETYLEKLFSSYKPINTGSCPVCRSHTILVDGFPVTFKASIAEPSMAIKGVYELVLHTDGRIYTDWSRKIRYKGIRGITIDKTTPKPRRRKSLPSATRGCGGVVSSGCGYTVNNNSCGRSSGGC